ncbi:hypothetical protein Aspvir_001632 [Aspergillus viridinutans]|uniref:DUF7587 domain-containing protein n=1 Tax=Aspergillus viridinutans TaxID=75553 RepID=A0A9P3F2W8_ASPVI|nr:uncharacterized protein Aspvir_001632 [Aspergillus viridinutans]GIJ99500.1 hypothetical protein Aspvir_001632 [Aspergillus viridinutans]
MQSVPFNANPFLVVNMRHFTKRSRPRYLFRVHAPYSAGESSANSVRSPAALYNHPEQADDLFVLDPSSAAESLKNHLYWRCDDRCNLMSWTTSLLFALQYGLHRHRTDDDHPAFEDIFLLMIDTRAFPERTFIKDLEVVSALDTHDGYWDDYLTLRGTGYFGEYLSQGALDINGKCVQVSFQTLIDLGLFELLPPLAVEAEWEKWARRVIELRRPFYRREVWIPTPDEVRTTVQLARHGFGGRWTFPIAAMLLALRPRANNDQVIIEGLEVEFSRRLTLESVKMLC